MTLRIITTDTVQDGNGQDSADPMVYPVSENYQPTPSSVVPSGASSAQNILTVWHEIEGTARAAEILFNYEAPDYGCNQQGGWFLAVANIPLSPGMAFAISRPEFAYLFGSTALRVAEESAQDLAASRYEE